MFFKIGVLKNFAVFTGKHLRWSLFLIKLQRRDFIKNRLQHRCFLISFHIFFPRRETLSSGVSRVFSTPVYRFGRPNYVPKLKKNSLEKIPLTQISGDKTSLQLYLNTVRNLTLRYFCFFKKAITTIFMLYFNQFLLPILNWVFCPFCTLLLIFSKHL